MRNDPDQSNYTSDPHVPPEAGHTPIVRGYERAPEGNPAYRPTTPPPGYGYPGAPEYSAPVKKKGKKGLVIAIILLVVALLLGAAAYYYFFVLRPETKAESEEEEVVETARPTRRSAATEAPEEPAATPEPVVTPEPAATPEPEVTPEPVPVETTEEFEQLDVPGVWDMTDRRVTPPAEGEWLPAYDVRFVNPYTGDYIFLLFAPVEGSERIGNLPEKLALTRLAIHGDYTLVRAKTGEFGWVRSDRIVADNTSDEQPVFVTAPKNGEWLDNTEERIVNPFVGDYIYLRYHPVEDSDRICNIYKGEVVTLLAQHEDYSLVMTQSGATGWVLTDRLIKR